MEGPPDEPADEPTESPTNTTAQAAAEGSWMRRQWIAIASVSILSLVVVAIVLLQSTGVIDVLGPFGDSTAGQWIVIAVLVAAVAIVATWGWRAVIASGAE